MVKDKLEVALTDAKTMLVCINQETQQDLHHMTEEMDVIADCYRKRPGITWLIADEAYRENMCMMG